MGRPSVTAFRIACAWHHSHLTARHTVPDIRLPITFHEYFPVMRCHAVGKSTPVPRPPVPAAVGFLRNKKQKASSWLRRSWALLFFAGFCGFFPLPSLPLFYNSSGSASSAICNSFEMSAVSRNLSAVIRIFPCRSSSSPRQAQAKMSAGDL